MSQNDPLATIQTLARLLAPEQQPALAPQLVAPDFDWAAPIAIANAQLVVCALDAALRAKGLTAEIDAEAAAYLQAAAELNRGRNAAILADLEQLAEALTRVGIHAVVLKGAALLAAGRYRDPADRLMVDLDVLVAPTQLDDALAAARALGWRDLDEPEPAAAHHAPALVRPGCRARIELHHALGGPELPVELGAEAVLARAVAVRLGRAWIWIPSAADLVIHNVVHAQLQHRGYRRAELMLRDAYDLVVALGAVPAGERAALGVRLTAIAGPAAGFYVGQTLALFGQPALPGLPSGPVVRWRTWRWRRHARGRLLGFLILPEAAAFVRSRLGELLTMQGRRRLGPLLLRPSRWRWAWQRVRQSALFGAEMTVEAPDRPATGARRGALSDDRARR